MVYIDGSGQVTNAPLTYKITEFFKNFYFALVLFISTLFYPTTIRKIPKTSSFQSSRNLRSNGANGSGGGGGGGGTTASGRTFGGGGSATLSDLSTGPVLRPMGGCAGGSCG